MNKPIKVLSLSAHFELPYEFEGTLAQAIRLLATYHENVGLSNPERKVEKDQTERSLDEMWSRFMLMIHLGKGKCAMDVAVNAYDPETGKMTKLEIQ